MMFVLCRHMLESTLFCGVIACFALVLRGSSAAVKHTIWFIGLLKFAIPASMLAIVGARVGVLFPVSYSLPSFAFTLSWLLASLGMLPQRMMSADFNMISILGLLVWVTGSVVFVIAWCLRLRACSRDLTPPPTEELAVLKCAKQKLGIRRPVDLCSSKTSAEPRLLGVFHPIVTIPMGLFKRLNPLEFEGILLHELSHARRWDNLSGSLAHLLVCVFWFHPVVWWMESRLIAEREYACDELVLRAGASPSEYVTGILKVCQFHLLGTIPGTNGIAGSDLKDRMDLVLSWRQRKLMHFAPRLLLIFLTFVMTLLPLAGGYCQQCVSNGLSSEQINSSRPSKEEFKRANPNGDPFIR